jgi:hypothetical protein
MTQRTANVARSQCARKQPGILHGGWKGSLGLLKGLGVFVDAANTAQTQLLPVGWLSSVVGLRVD